MPCWVAQEVYGIENPKWIEFRTWLFGDGELPQSETLLQRTYLKHGQKFAARIKNRPMVKFVIRQMMNVAMKIW
jgi:hypothetical protein